MYLNQGSLTDYRERQARQAVAEAYAQRHKQERRLAIASAHAAKLKESQS